MKKYAIIFAALLITTPMASQAWCGTPLSNPAVTTCMVKDPETGKLTRGVCPVKENSPWKNIALHRG